MTQKLSRTALLLVFFLGSICSAAYAQGDAPKDKKDPKTWHDEGLYYYNANNPNSLFTLIDPSMPNGTKTGGYGQRMAQGYSAGFAKAKTEAILSGANSKTVIKEKSPVFYFYFKSDNLSPKAFALVKLTEKKHERLMVTGTHNAYGSSTGIDEKQIVDFSYEKLSDGIFKVFTKEPLKEGEYCFYYIGKSESSFAEGFYDFGISVD